MVSSQILDLRFLVVKDDLDLRFPNIASLLIFALTRLAPTCIAEASPAHACHDVAPFAPRYDDVTVWAWSRVLSQPAHERVILVSNCPQILQVVCMFVIFVTIEYSFAQQFPEVLLHQAVATMLCWTFDVQLVIIDGCLCPSLHAGPAECVATGMIRPMLIFAKRSAPRIRQVQPAVRDRYAWIHTDGAGYNRRPCISQLLNCIDKHFVEIFCCQLTYAVILHHLFDEGCALL